MKRFLKICSLFLVIVLLANILPTQCFAASVQASQAEVTETEGTAPVDSTAVAVELSEKRTAYTKDFRLPNGLYMSAVYAEPVHYEKDGQWAEIDNTLTLDANGCYSNAAGVWDVRLPQQLSSSSDISITKDGYTLTFRMSGALTGSGLATARSMDALQHTSLGTASAMVQQIDLRAEKEAAEIPQAVVEKNHSRLTYENILTGTNVQYDLQSNTVKESVILESYNAALRGYRYTLNVGQMVPVLEDDGGITLYDENQKSVVMVMPAPFLVDGNGVRCDDVQVTLSGNGSLYTLCYMLPTEWLVEEDRAWPVVLDPIVKAEMDENNILDYTVTPTKTYPAGHGVIECGYDVNHGGIHRSVLQYSQLPDLSAGSQIVDARLCLTLEAGYSDDYIVEAHKLNNTWSYSTLTWATVQDYNPIVEDYVVADTKNKSYEWIITDIVRNWYSNSNTGLLLKASADMERGSRQNWMQFMSSDNSISVGGPTLFVTYQHNSGIESHYSYQTMSAGHAGTAYVSDSTGQLSVAKNIASYASSVNPFNMNMVYSSSYFTNSSTAKDKIQSTHGIDMLFGAGFTWSIIQSVEKAEIAKENKVYTYYVWHDGDGTDHYFWDMLGNGKYIDETGLDRTITASGNDYTMTNDQGYTWFFDDGLLSEMYDTAGNKIWIDWQGSGNKRWFKKIYQRNKNGSDILVADITYIPNTSYINTLTDAAGRVLTFGYTGDNLTSLSLDGTQIATYQYDNNRLKGMLDAQSLYWLWFEYYDSSDAANKLDSGKIKSIQEWIKSTSNSKSGAQIDVSYENGITVYQDYGVDRQKDTQDDLYTQYSFDYTGRTVNASTRDVDGKILGVTNQTFTGAGGESGNLRQNNRVLQTASMGVAAENLLKNHSFESGTDSWFLQGTNSSGTLRASTYTSRSGYKSLEGHTTATYDGTLTAYRTQTLNKETTYTFSAYVDTSWIESFGTGGIRLVAHNSTYGTWHGSYLTEITSGTDLWKRISLTFTPSTTADYSLMLQAVDVTGYFYVDDLQLEVGEAPSNYNMMENGSLSLGQSGWLFQPSTATYSGGTPVGSNKGSGNNLLRIPGSPSTDACAWQNVNVNAPSSQTYVLSGWAWADSVADNDNPESNDNYASDTTKSFGLRATVRYAEGGEEHFYAPFCPGVDGWQFTSVTIVPKETSKTIDYIQVVCAYEKNANTAWFDNICLVEEAAQTMRYDDEGNLISVTTTDLDNQSAQYDGSDLISLQTGGFGDYEMEYDDNHRLTSITDGIVKQTNTYDSFGNVIGTTLIKDDGTGQALTTSAEYINNGNQLYTVTDANGSQVWYYYDNALSKMSGSPTRVCTAPAGTVDNDTPNGAWQYSYTTYDKFMRATRMQLDNLATIDYTYDSGNLTKINRTAGGTTQTYTLEYDDWGNNTSVAVADWVLSTYTYGADNGPLQTMTYGNGDKVAYTYDPLGRTKTVTYKDENNTPTRTLTYTYTGDGQVYSIHDSATGKTTTYTYDTLNRLIASQNGDVRGKNTYNTYNQLTGWSYSSKLDNASETYTYDTSKENAISDGTLTSMKMVNGDTISYTYDALQRLTYKELNSGKEGGGIWEGYVYNGTQVAVKRNWIDDDTMTHQFAYTYDTVGNITQEKNVLNGSTVTYTYDRLNQLTGAVHKDKNGNTLRTEKYTYDNAGNILTFDNNVGKDNAIRHTSYSYPDIVNSTGAPGWKDLLRKLDGETITYDDSGNPLTYHNGYSQPYYFTWSEGRRLETYTYNGQTTTYQYDADGLRTKKINPNGTYIVYTVADGHYLGEIHYTSAGITDLYIRYNYDESGSVVGISLWDSGNSTAWTDYYFIKNLQGDVLQVYEASENKLVASYSYDSWGNVLSASNYDTYDGRKLSQLNPFRYRSYYYDEETFFYYLQSRYYDPAIGRFINGDGFCSTGQGVLGHNMFAYCGDNPVCRVDPTGTCYYTTNGNWTHDAWENLGGYVKQEDPGYYAGTTPSDLDVYVVPEENYILPPHSVKIVDRRETNYSSKTGKNDPNFQIRDSYKITNRADLVGILSILRAYDYFHPSVHKWTRGNDLSSLVVEWEAHNFIYKIKNNYHCQHVDLNNEDAGVWYIGFGWRAITSQLEEWGVIK